MNAHVMSAEAMNTDVMNADSQAVGSDRTRKRFEVQTRCPFFA
ncbi:hypothetical protein [Alcanivorax quisquiliarum]|nr:hypothetical protein [Alcanivorax quisquiliarum]